MGEDIVTTYGSRLADLKINSKPLINLLTMMAEDYIRHAPIVVQVIEKHLVTVKPEIKLPVLYLIDSIIKNVKKDYVQLFTQNIVSTFCGVFEKVDEKTRGMLWKLRGTWNDHFPQKKLYAIDLRCREADPKWPIMSVPPVTGSIHVNPRFLNRNKTTAAAFLTTEQMPNTPTVVASSSAEVTLDGSEVQMRAQLLAKQKELLELQTKKVELELLQTKLQIEEKTRRQKEEEVTAKQTLKQERLLLGMAEAAKNRTEQCKQQLQAKPTTALGPSTSISSNVKSSSNSSKAYDGSSDRESHSSLSAKLTKTSSETSVSSIDSSPSKKSKSSSRDKGDRDRRSRSKSDKGKDKEKDRHDSKDKESRHSRHRDKDRHGEGKDKNRSRENRERSRDVPSAAGKLGGEWKDYNEAKKASPSKRTNRDRKESGNSEDEIEEYGLDIKPQIPQLSLPTKGMTTLKGGLEEGSAAIVENDPRLSNPPKSPSLLSQTAGESGSSTSSGGSSPLKRRLPKDRQSDNDGKSENNSIESKDKITLSDPRLRRRMERDRGMKALEEKSEQGEKETPNKGEWKDYRERQQAVLRRNYRKTTGIEIKEDQSTDSTVSPMNVDQAPGDVDLRFDGHMDVDLRTESSDGSGPEPPTKKSRMGKDTAQGAFDDLFGHQDVDLRAGSSCWTQVKVKSESVVNRNPRKEEEDDPRTGEKVLRSPGPSSPANSVNSVSSLTARVDPLGRPLVFNRLPNDPEERKRSLDSRSTSIDVVEQFRIQHIDRILQGNAILSENDAKTICGKAKEELDQGILNKDQYVAIIKQILQIKEQSAMREVQQMQMKGESWQLSNNAAHNTPNPWVTDASENNIWAAFGSASTTATDFPGGFPRATPWDAPGATPWLTSNLPPAPAGPNPFEEAIARPMIDDLIPKPKSKDLVLADQDVGHTIPIDKVLRQIRFYRDTAVVLVGMMNDEPRELSFQRDDIARTVMINGKPLEIFIGETKKFDLNRQPHTIKLGVPGRELYIDDKRYELFFGGRGKHIFLNGRQHWFQLLPPNPQVAVGDLPRYDLVAGRVNLSIDAVSNVPVYLDEKLQKIDVFGEPLVLRFCNGFQTVTLNGRPFPTNFGARLPFTITMPVSGKHYLRFSAISPDTERAIQAFISANYGGDWTDARNNHFGGRGSARGGIVRGRGRAAIRGRRDLPNEGRAGPNPWLPGGPPEVSEPSSNFNSLDLLNNLFQAPTEATSKSNYLETSYESEPAAVEDGTATEESDKPSDASPTGNNLNVSDLVANLIKFGLLPAASAPTTEESATTAKEEASQEPEAVEESEDKVVDEVETKVEASEPQLKEKESEPEKPSIPPLPTVDVTFDDNMKERRDIAIGQIFTGVQCSQCGLRFPPDQTLRYSQHLDWHFRQNRRDKANARKALSRKWYYDLSDWIQFEEIEDLEERAASLFETQDVDNEHDAQSPSGALNSEECTVLASSHEGAICPQCGEEFQSYFDEEKEEWRMKNAKLGEYEGEPKLYHPICHEDYLKSLVDESIVDENETAPADSVVETKKCEEPEEAANTENAEREKDDDDEVLIIKEGKKEVLVMEIDIDIDDDVEKVKTNNSVTIDEEDNDNCISNDTKTDDNVTEKENINNEKSDENSCNNNINSNSSLDIPELKDSVVPSPIVIDEDSTFLPGLTVDAEGGVFGFALGTGSQPRSSQEPTENKIIYEPMKFDIPPIKLEPVDEEPVDSEDVALNPEEFLATFIPGGNRSPCGTEPMNIDLTEEDSTDAIESSTRLVTQITSIDGNLQEEEASTLPFIPAAKIRINISGMDTTPSGSPKMDSPQPSKSGESEKSENAESQEQIVVKDDGSANDNTNNSEINKDNPVEPVLTEEMKRLKPRLVGRKLTVCPPKRKGEELSGLCSIC